MSSSSKIEQYLEAIYRGQDASVSVLLPALANQFVFAPLLNIEHVDDERSTNRIRVATFASGLRKVVPVFTSKKIFDDWSDGRYSSFSVAGGDLALTLPKGSWLVLNPGKMHCLELSPDDVITLSKIDQPEFSLPIEELDAQVVARPQRFVEDMADDDGKVIDLTAENVPREHAVSPMRIERKSLPDLERDLSRLFLLYPEVQEAYFSETDSSQAVLGLLAPKLSPEQRFLLIDEIANLSRNTYGSAGAIEVYDDLNLKTSHSWALFSVLSPFYIRSEFENSELRLEKERIVKDELPPAMQSRADTRSWFGRFRKRRSP